ncbi:Hypothetical protein CINCED_3A015386 [Cinara cedri]|nr:Hypothetical protein CINCED_3A015386 [Cinara cedri]
MFLNCGSLAKLNSAMQAYDTICAERFKSAKSLYDEGNYASSQEACESLNLLQPNNMNIIILLSACHFMQGKYDESLEVLQKVPDKYRGCVEVINNLAANYYKKENYLEAFYNYHMTACKKPEFVEYWLAYVISSIATNNDLNAFRALNMILHYSPSSLQTHILYARLLKRSKRFDLAIASLRHAIRLNPTSDTIWVELGNSFALNNKFNSAIICYEKAIECNKFSIKPYINLGIMYYQLKQFNKSSFYFKTSVQMSPTLNFDILHILGHAYFYNGNILPAVQTYSLYLKHFNNPVVLNDMGLIYLNNLHDATAAESYFKLCIDLDKKNFLYFKCLAIAHQQLDKTSSAFKMAIKWAEAHIYENDIFNAIIALDYAGNMFPKNYYPHWKLGLLFNKLNLNHKALLRFENARRLKPNFFLNFVNIALIYEKQNRLKDAEEFYEKALQLNPNHCNTIYNLILLKKQMGLIDDVIVLYDLLLNYSGSESFGIHKEFANYFYHEVGNIKEAYNHFLKASEICDTDCETYLALGILSLELSYKTAALNYFQKVLELDPDSIIAYTYKGYIFNKNKQFKEAINAFEKVLNLEPDNINAFCHLIQCQRYVCKFRNLDVIHLNMYKTIIFEQLANNEVPIITLQHSLLFNFESKVTTQIASAFAKQFVDKLYIQKKSITSFVHDTPISDNKIRIGYVYMDFCNHPSSELVKSLKKLHDRNRFEVFCYSLSPINRFRSNNLSESDWCVDISNLGSIDAAKRINADGINILIDVGDSTKDLEYEMFVLKPAPIQVKLLGHPGTSGATFVDFLITDEICSPPNLDYLYTEKLAYLNRTVFFGDHSLLNNDLSQRNSQSGITNTNNTNDTNLTESSTSILHVQIFLKDYQKCYTRKIYNLPENSIVYCNFGQHYKINQSTLNLWITILKLVKNSVLWLLRFGDDTINDIHEYIALKGINPTRVIFSNIVPKDEHLKRIQLADIFLDTPLYNGHKCCLDALWAGTPIVTLSGDTYASRIATSQLIALNCTETIAETENDYIKLAVQLGKHPHLLDRIRQQIWQSKSTSSLFDCKSYSKELEKLYLNMWKQYFNRC